ncbi:hypothetical protein [Mycolicibacterium setense]
MPDHPRNRFGRRMMATQLDLFATSVPVYFQFTRCDTCGYAIGNVIHSDHPGTRVGLVAEWAHVDRDRNDHYPDPPRFAVRDDAVIDRHNPLWHILKRQKEWI